ncbi:MAG: DEAD/DEAH box helicase, partial [Alicyclobacillaceae bacterium]|nr:DEAD/DEAH box helicase [Alicyclobacillaceae bacterium]
MSFPVGSRVRIRSEEWLVRGVKPLRQPGHYALYVVGLSETVRDYEATFLTSIDKPKLIDPAAVRFVEDDSPEYRRSRLFLHALMSRTPWVGEHITIRGQVAMEDNEYQFVPAQKALAQPRPRILIADGVGLGKTIEAGILMAELIRRGRGTRILVVTTKAMLEQVQKELWTRFSIPLMRLDSYGIDRIRREIPVNKNPFYHYDRVIVSMDTLKSDRYRSFIEQCRWDIVWIDECHNVANAGTERNRLADKLAQTTHALILTSATPHNGNPESFATLIRMLDPTAAPDAKKLTREDIDHLVVRRFKTDVMQ